MLTVVLLPSLLPFRYIATYCNKRHCQSAGDQVPVGAVLVAPDGTLLAEAANETNARRDSTPLSAVQDRAARWKAGDTAYEAP